MGQRTHLSRLDIRIMSFLYPRDNWVFADVTATGLWPPGTFFEPFTSFLDGYENMPEGGRLWLLHAGEYVTGGLLEKRGVIQAPLGALLVE